MKSTFTQRISRVLRSPYLLLDRMYLYLDRRHIRRAENLRLIPPKRFRIDGKYSYAEWAYLVGIFQSLVFLHLEENEEGVILDIGCGTGLLAAACEPFLRKNGRYIGIDLVKERIEFCRRQYDSSQFEFIHFQVRNPVYAPSVQGIQVKWPVENEVADLITASSVWTHMNEADALFYCKELTRILKPGGKAIMTVFLLDEDYRRGLGSRIHSGDRNPLIFDQPAYRSDAWFHPEWVKVPENEMGFTRDGLERLVSGSGLELTAHYPGSWKGVSGILFQDVLVFQKT